MFASIGTTEIIIIIIIVILLFGNKEIKQIVRTFVKIKHTLQKTSNEIKSEINQILDDDNLSG